MSHPGSGNRIGILIPLLFLCGLSPWAVDPQLPLRPALAAVPPVIDGDLGDPAWGEPIVLCDFITYNPTRGAVLPMATKVWMTYDREYLYLAFACQDPEPSRIKATITKRDNLFADDWVGFSLDSLGNKQASYDFFVNAHGIQGDILDTTSNGEDSSPDYVWDSAGRISAAGYQAEIRLPWRSIQFRSGETVSMGILFWRRISRLGVSGSWPEMKAGQGLFNAHAPVEFHDLKAHRTLEVLPDFVFSRSQDRATPGEWKPADSHAEVGIGIKYGLTSSTSAEVTVNPDFSQVESDAFQVEVNQRYPIFYSEKRPFFMEIGSLFNIAGTGGDFNMRTAIDTRRIVDPDWGAKLLGSTGRLSFGFLAAADAWPGRVAAEDEPWAGGDALFAIGRSRWSLEGQNYVGGIFSLRNFDGRSNLAAGADGMIKVGENHWLSFSLLGTRTRDPETTGQDGAAGVFSYEYSTKRMGIWADFEGYSSGFQMDTAFYERTGILKWNLYVGPQFYPEGGRFAWVQKINPFFFGYYLHDTVTGMDDQLAIGAIRFFFTRQGQFRLDLRHFVESWAGEKFPMDSLRLQGGVQLTNWLRLDGSFTYGDRLFYDPEHPFAGWGQSADAALTFQPDDRFTQSLEIAYTDLNRKDDGQRIYSVTIVNSRTTYQFNRYFFLRGTLQYDNYYRRVLLDGLASFTLIPGTVLHLGYGSLVERRAWQDDGWVNESGDWQAMRRGLFFKVSYLWRL